MSEHETRLVLSWAGPGILEMHVSNYGLSAKTAPRAEKIFDDAMVEEVRKACGQKALGEDDLFVVHRPGRKAPDCVYFQLREDYADQDVVRLVRGLDTVLGGSDEGVIPFQSTFALGRCENCGGQYSDVFRHRCDPVAREERDLAKLKQEVKAVEEALPAVLPPGVARAIATIRKAGVSVMVGFSVQGSVTPVNGTAVMVDCSR